MKLSSALLLLATSGLASAAANNLRRAGSSEQQEDRNAANNLRAGSSEQQDRKLGYYEDCYHVTIDFERNLSTGAPFKKGDIISDLGMDIEVDGQRLTKNGAATLSGDNRAMIFDTNHPTGGDYDLGAKVGKLSCSFMVCCYLRLFWLYCCSQQLVFKRQRPYHHGGLRFHGPR